MSTGSDSLFTNKTRYRLNQLFGYQDADEHRENENRLRDAFQDQHAWNDNMDNADWQAAFPNWNLGAHRGTVGIDMRGIGNDETFFFGDGSGLTNITKGGMNNLCQIMATNDLRLPVSGSPSDSIFATTFANNLGNNDRNKHGTWPLSWVANSNFTSTNLAGQYWGPSWLGSFGANLGYGAQWYDGAAIRADLPGGTPWLHLGGDFEFHHRFLFIYWSFASSVAWGGAPFSLQFRFLGSDGIIYGTNGAGDSLGYSDGVITITPITVDTNWTGTPWVCETAFTVTGLPEQNYLLQYGLNTPGYGSRFASVAHWVGIDGGWILARNDGGSYPSITPPGAWELTRGRHNAIFPSAPLAQGYNGVYDYNQFIAWTTSD